MITREFKLYLNAGVGVAPVINVNQFDQDEEWIFTLLQSDGTVYTPSTGAIIGLKQDGTTILNAGTVNSSGQVVITETEQMTAVPGSNLFEILIDGNSHGTANFVVFVERRPGDIDNPSESDISLFQEAIEAAGNVTQFQADISALQSGLATTNANLTSEANTRASADATLQSNISAEASTRSTQDAVLQAEIDQLIAPTGEAPSAAEVQNARIGVDGTTYDTLGNAIRGQVGDLKNALNNVNGALDESNVIYGKKYGFAPYINDGANENLKSLICTLPCNGSTYGSLTIYHSKGKNLITKLNNTQTLNGVTFTVNADGTITTSGTASANTTFIVQYGFPVTKGVSYGVSGCPSGGGTDTYTLSVGGAYGVDSGSGANFKLNFDLKADVRITVKSGTDMSGLTFKPMVRYLYGKSEPSRNLLTATPSNAKINGLDFTVNPDNSITVTGTASANTTFYIQTGMKFEVGNTYILNGCPYGGSASTYRMNIGGVYALDTGSGGTYTPSTTITADVRIVINIGVTMLGQVFRPQLTLLNDHNNKFVSPNYDTHVIGFTATIYGGYVDITNGKLYATRQQDGTVINPPAEYNITPHNIEIIEGDNTISTSAGYLSVEYLKDINIDRERTEINISENSYLSAIGDDTDMSDAIASLLKKYSVVNLGAGEFHVDKNITLPEGCTINGQGENTVIIAKQGLSYVFNLTNKNTVKNLAIKGGYTGTKSSVGNHHAITIMQTDSHNNISNIYVQDFDGAGVYTAETFSTELGHYSNIIANSRFINCGCGVYLGTHSEAFLISNCAIVRSYIGVHCIGGNNRIADSIVRGCVNGINMVSSSTSDNDGHSIFNGTIIIHNTHAIVTNTIEFGAVFSGCTIFYGDITVTDSKGIMFIGCEIGSVTAISSTGTSAGSRLSNCMFNAVESSVVTGFVLNDCTTLTGDAFEL